MTKNKVISEISVVLVLVKKIISTGKYFFTKKALIETAVIS